MMDNETYRRLHAFVATGLLNGDARDLDENTPLLAWGVLDSMAMIQLTEFIEQELEIAIPTDALLDSANLETLATITQMVEKYGARR
jgi:acyl carrier protein